MLLVVIGSFVMSKILWMSAIANKCLKNKNPPPIKHRRLIVSYFNWYFGPTHQLISVQSSTFSGLMSRWCRSRAWRCA